MKIRTVVVFCGSQNGNNPLFVEDAKKTGMLLARANLQLIYGGGKRGLMGALADAVLLEGGKVAGVIPALLTEREHQHEKLTELSVVPDMHSRKKILYERGDVAIILPGGFGTLDELFEMLTWNQLKLHDKKIFVLNTAGFYTHLYQHLQTVQREGFLYDDPGERIFFCGTPEEIFEKMA